MNPTVSVVIAAKNEEDNVGWVAARLRDVDEIILVDGNSTDNTIAAWKSVHAHVTVIGQQHPGKGAAVAAGLMAATGDIVIMLDADGSMDPLEIPALVGALKAGADVVKGSRRAPGGGSNDLSIVRKTGNRALTILANTLYRQRWSELNYGMAGFWRDTLRQLGVEELVDGTDAPQTGPVSSRLLAGAQKGRTRQQLRYGHGFEIEAVLFCRAARQGLRVTETASFEYDRRYGHSNLDTWRDGLRVLAAIAHERAVATRKHHP